MIVPTTHKPTLRIGWTYSLQKRCKVRFATAAQSSQVSLSCRCAASMEAPSRGESAQRCPQPTRRPRRAAMMLPVTVGVAHAVHPSVTIGDEQNEGGGKGRRCSAACAQRSPQEGRQAWEPFNERRLGHSDAEALCTTDRDRISEVGPLKANRKRAGRAWKAPRHAGGRALIGRRADSEAGCRAVSVPAGRGWRTSLPNPHQEVRVG